MVHSTNVRKPSPAVVRGDPAIDSRRRFAPAPPRADRRSVTSRPEGAGIEDQQAMTPEREQELLAAHRAGDPDALSSLLRGYQRRLFAICYRMVHRPDVATDLTQDALVKIIQGLPRYDGRSALSTWIVRVTMNCCLSHLRKQKLRDHASLDDVGHSGVSIGSVLPDKGEPSGADRVQRDERAALLERGLDQLDPETRAILVLRDVQDLDYARIGTVLDIPVGTVKSRLFRARLALREAIERLSGHSDDSDGPSEHDGRSGSTGADT